MQCPECGSSNVARSRRHGFVERTILTPVFVYPFRCGECQHRFKYFLRAKLNWYFSSGGNMPRPLRALMMFLALVLLSIVTGFFVTRCAPTRRRIMPSGPVSAVRAVDADRVASAHLPGRQAL